MKLQNYKEFICYGIIGVINTGIHFIFFFGLEKISSQTLANSVAFSVAVVFSFFCNSFFTFKKRPTKRKFLKMYFSMLLVSAAFGYIGDSFQIFPLVTITIYFIFNPIIGFLITKYFVFG